MAARLSEGSYTTMFRSAHMSTLLLAIALMGLISQWPATSGNSPDQVVFVPTTATTTQTLGQTVYLTATSTITDTVATTVDQINVFTATPTVTAAVPVSVTQTNTQILLQTATFTTTFTITMAVPVTETQKTRRTFSMVVLRTVSLVGNSTIAVTATYITTYTPIFDKGITDWSFNEYMFLSALGLTVMLGFVLGYFLPSRKAKPIQSTKMILQGTPSSTGVASDIGSRSENQDSAVLSYTKKSGALSQYIYRVVVADGVSGEAEGKIASSLAVNSILRSMGDADSSSVSLRKAVHEANQAVLDYSVGKLQGQRLATTAVAAVVDREGASIANVGDSRGYLYRGGKLFLLTKDHTVTQQLLAGVKITPAEALNHPDRHKLTKALGQKTVEPEVNAYEVARGDIFLLCSDGLTDGLTDSQMESIIQGKQDMQKLSEMLVYYAKSAGVQDNITVALLRVD